jgi:hypothetical protein
MSDEARHGWSGGFPVFVGTPREAISASLRHNYPDVSPEQVTAWRNSIPSLQNEVREIIDGQDEAKKYSVILEYELPLESRRPDVLFLLSGAVVVLELKGKIAPTQADLDQASGYARDLRCYHRECENNAVHAILVPMRAQGYQGMESGVHICGPDALDVLVSKLDAPRTISPIDPTRFVAVEAYQPLPTLVKAARDLFLRQPLPWIKRARAFTDPALEYVSSVIHEAHRTKTRRLVLLTGVPGSGKTLVGMQIVHAGFLDDLAVPRATGKSSTPAIFLSGNGPLVEVLQYQLRQAGVGGDGKVFVRGVKDYVKTYNKKGKVPPEHVLVFDEAQRAWDAEQMAEKHEGAQKSEPEAFVEFSERIPEWCVVLGLIGSGQEIHKGEEGGLIQWRDAILKSPGKSDWVVHVPENLKTMFGEAGVPCEASNALSLVYSLRHHGAVVLHEWVAGLVDEKPTSDLFYLSEHVAKEGMHLRITRDLNAAKMYLKDRYADNPNARYGILTSSRDRSLSTRPIHVPLFGEYNWKGPWFTDGEESTGSCRRLDTAISEFDCQGLELEGSLVIWGTDFLWKDGVWSNESAKRYQRVKAIKDALQLRKNAYRVLLTRARDVSIVWIPSEEAFDATYQRLIDSGAVEI